MAHFESRKLVSMKVVLPRSDTKLDQEKRTEKDFKEKVAVMEQLYRALWEVRNLDFWQSIHFWITRDIRISFEMYVEKGQLLFYVVTQPKFISIVEKQITAFYGDAEVTLEPTPEVRPKGYSMIGYYLKFSEEILLPAAHCTNSCRMIPSTGSVTCFPKWSAMKWPPSRSYSRRLSARSGTGTPSAASAGFKGKKEGMFAHIPVLGFLLSGLSEFTSSSTNAPGAKGGDSFVRMGSRRKSSTSAWRRREA